MPWAGRHMAPYPYRYYIIQTALIRRITNWFYNFYNLVWSTRPTSHTFLVFPIDRYGQRLYHGYQDTFIGSESVTHNDLGCGWLLTCENGK